MKETPRITVVTPSYNQGQFLEETILSVLEQGYPNLEYIVVDGGSTDNSVEIIRRYEQHLAYWESQKDRGQSHAINKGFARSTGQILCWLNSDDMHQPGTLREVSETLDITRPELMFGNCQYIEDGKTHPWETNVAARHRTTDLALSDYIIQPSSFWTRAAWERVGQLDESLHYGMDWEWFLRARSVEVAFRPVDTILSIYRLHPDHKTRNGGERRQQELATIFNRYVGPHGGELFLTCCREHTRIDKLLALLNRLRVHRYDTYFCKLMFGGPFLKFSSREVRQILTMVSD
jgi:glycosyltransferase involved in cell wall biosynthesis